MTNRKIVFDGQIYNSEDEIPYLGSISAVKVNGNVREYEGKYEDRFLLPKYDNLAIGSSAFLSKNGEFVVFKYYPTTKTWEGNGEVI